VETPEKTYTEDDVDEMLRIIRDICDPILEKMVSSTCLTERPSYSEMEKLKALIDGVFVAFNPMKKEKQNES
jgi:hypothetical protein